MEVKRRIALGDLSPSGVWGDSTAQFSNFTLDFTVGTGDADALVLFLNKRPDADEFLEALASKPNFYLFLAKISQSALPKEFYTPKLLRCILKGNDDLEQQLNSLVLVLPDYPCLFSDLEFLNLFFALKDSSNKECLQLHYFLLSAICRECVVQMQFLLPHEMEEIQKWAFALNQNDIHVYSTSFAELNQSALHYFVLAATKLAENGQFIDLRVAVSLSPQEFRGYILALNERFPEHAASIYASDIVTVIDFIPEFVDFLREGNDASEIMELNADTVARILVEEVYSNPDVMEIVARLQSQGIGSYVDSVQQIIDIIE